MTCESAYQYDLRKVVAAPEEVCGTFQDLTDSFVVDSADDPSFGVRGDIRSERTVNASGFSGARPALPSSFGWTVALPMEMHCPADEPWPLWARFLLASGFRGTKNDVDGIVTLEPSTVQGLSAAPADFDVPTVINPFAMSVAIAEKDATLMRSRGTTFATTIQAQNGQPVQLQCTGPGLLVDDAVPESTLDPDDPAYAALGSLDLRDFPLIALNAQITLTGSGPGNAPLGVESWQLACNQDVSDASDMRRASGLAPVVPRWRPGSPPTLSITFDQVASSRVEAMRRLRAQETGTFEATFALLDGSGRQVKISCPWVQYSSVGKVDANGRRQYQCELAVVSESITDNEFLEIEYTYAPAPPS